jgi:DNA-damage-inducible protein J
MVHVRIDPKVRAKAEKALLAMGLSVSDAVRVLLTRIAKDKAFPLDLCPLPHVPNVKTIASMGEFDRGEHKSFDTVKEMMADLDAGD